VRMFVSSTFTGAFLADRLPNRRADLRQQTRRMSATPFCAM
jgi:hypothetical protein